jgi:hypothetical protein
MIFVLTKGIIMSINLTSNNNSHPNLLQAQTTSPSIETLDVTDYTDSNDRLTPLLNIVLSYNTSDERLQLQSTNKFLFRNTHLHKTPEKNKDYELICRIYNNRIPYLHLEGCRSIPKSLFITINRLDNLQSLNLSNSIVSDKDLAIFEVIKDKKGRPISPSMRVLNLSYCHNISGRSFENFQKVENLNLTGCSRIAKDGYTNIGRMNKLQILILSNTNATDANVAQTTKAHNLIEVDLTGCKYITKDIINIFFKRLTDNPDFTLKLDKRIPLPLGRTKKMDSRHSILDPLRPQKNGKPADDQTIIQQINQWKDTITQKRAKELFQHETGLAGHLKTIGDDLQRMTPLSLKGYSQPVKDAAKQAQKEVHRAILNAKSNEKFKSTDTIKDMYFPMLGQTLVAGKHL